MKTFSILILIFVIITSINVSAAILNVPGDFATIQEALDSYVVADGDTILVQPGIYRENINFRGHDVIVGSLFFTTGDRSYISSTILNGDSSGSVVTFENREKSSAAIIGFMITNGYAELGGGIRCINSEPTISDNIIAENTAGREGGGIYSGYSSPVIRNNTITRNQAVQGGGISYRYYKSAIGSGNMGYEFIARGYPIPPIENNIISRNSASRGGGIYSQGSRLLICNNAVTGNIADNGGGVFCLDAGLEITSTILWENTADEGAQVFGSAIDINYSDIQGGREGEGNIDLDPLFRDAENDDFRLMRVACGDSDDSPCIDAGSPDFIDSLLECSWGLGTVLCDIGAYGGGAAATPSETVLRVPYDYQTIQQAINASSDDDTVLVYPGTYVENIDFDGRNVRLGSLYMYTRNYSHMSSTVINGNSSGSVVSFENGEDSSAVIAGFTLRNGLAENGGGIYCFYSAPTIMDNFISENTAISEGGGVFCFFSNPVIKYNIILDNSAISGGGIDCRYSSPVISGNRLIRNEVSWEGGGIFCRDNSMPTIQGNEIRENLADDGGGILCRYSDPSISNTVISSNSADRGGGLFFVGSDPAVVNVVIAGNIAEFGGGIFSLNSTPLVTNTIAWYNVAEDGSQIFGDSPYITYSDIQGGCQGQGNIDVAPLFRDTTGGDFHLVATNCGDPSDSPCIDAGDPAVSDSLLDCSWGLGAIHSDMGAYGGGRMMTGIDDVHSEISRRLALARNYPNPFNVSTSLEYNLSEASYLNIDIYNILGQRVATLFDGTQDAGQHTIIWDATAFPSGVYFARLKTKRHSQTIRLVLLK